MEEQESEEFYELREKKIQKFYDDLTVFIKDFKIESMEIQYNTGKRGKVLTILSIYEKYFQLNSKQHNGRAKEANRAGNQELGRANKKPLRQGKGFRATSIYRDYNFK